MELINLLIGIWIFMNNQSKRKKMGAKGKNRIELEFSIDKMVDSFIECIKKR